MGIVTIKFVIMTKFVYLQLQSIPYLFVGRASKWDNQTKRNFCKKIAMPFSSPLFWSTKLNNSRKIPLPSMDVAAPPLLFPFLWEVGSLICV